MHLPETDVELFYKLHPALLQYVNNVEQILPHVRTPQEMKDAGIENIPKVREALWKNPAYISDFVLKNPFGFSKEELDIVANWKHFVRANFFVISHLKKYSVFLEGEKQEPKAYGVLALQSPLENVIPYLPAYLEAILIPFRQSIIYDGIFFTRNITFGPGYRRGLNEDYRQAAARFGIITSLPFMPQEESERDRLVRFLHSYASRNEHKEEIYRLITQHREFLCLYHETLNRIAARQHAKDLNRVGINGWFALLEQHVIASGRTKEETAKHAYAIVSPERHDLVYIFQIKKKD